MKTDLPIIVLISIIVYVIFNIGTSNDSRSRNNSSYKKLSHYQCASNINLSCSNSDTTCIQLKNTCKSLFIIKKYKTTLQKEIKKGKGRFLKKLFYNFGCEKNLKKSFYKQLNKKYSYIYKKSTKHNASSSVLHRIKRSISLSNNLSNNCKYIY